MWPWIHQCGFRSSMSASMSQRKKALSGSPAYLGATLGQAGRWCVTTMSPFWTTSSSQATCSLFCL